LSVFESKVVVLNEEGLHARPAGILAKAASQFSAKIEVIANGQTKNAKSIMSLLSLGIKAGQEIVIKAEGEDAQMSVSSIVKLFECRFQD
jgi:phosphotransferase system HPr (HPr) family protein